MKSHQFYLNVAIMMLLITSSGCAGKKIVIKDSGMTRANLSDTLKGSKDVLNTYGFDLQDIDEDPDSIEIESKHPEGQRAWVTIEKMTDNTSDVTVKVNKKGRVKSSADDILQDIEVKF